jgi:hypothetical protein
VETTPRSCNSAHGTVEVQVWSCGLLWIFFVCLACSPASASDAKMLVASLPSASPGGWLQVSAGSDPAYASKLSYPLM